MGTKAQCLIMLFFTSRNGVNLSAHGAGKLNGKVAKATDANNSYPVAALEISFQGSIDCYARA
jgi:hypothetical protein